MNILFYPEKLTIKTRVSRVGRILKDCPWVKFHNDPSKPYDLHIFWSYTRNKITPDKLTLTDKNVINRGCWDISKVKVNDIFNDISIDPTTHKGLCVEKRDWQGGHAFHSVIQCPAAPKPGYIYQKCIKNVEDNLYVRYRVYYMGGITHVAKRYEKIPFVTSTVKVDFIEPDNFFTPKEKADFVHKCKLFGVDFGEVDVLIDNGEKIVIDVNNIVGGNHPPLLMKTKEYKEIDQTFLEFIKRNATI